MVCSGYFVPSPYARKQASTHCKALPVWSLGFPRRERAAWRSARFFILQRCVVFVRGSASFLKHKIRNRNNKHNQKVYFSPALCFKLSIGTHMLLFTFCKTRFILQCPKTDLSTLLSNSLYRVKPNSCVQPGSFTEPWNCGE